MSLASTFPFRYAKEITPHDTNQITNFDGNEFFARGIWAFTTAGIIYVRVRGKREDSGDDLDTATNLVPVYLALGSFAILEFDLVRSTDATAVGIAIGW